MAESERLRRFRLGIAITGFFVFSTAVMVDAYQTESSSPSAVSVFGILFIAWLTFSLIAKIVMIIGDFVPAIDIASTCLWVMAALAGGLKQDVMLLIAFAAWAAIDAADLVIVKVVKKRGNRR